MCSFVLMLPSTGSKARRAEEVPAEEAAEEATPTAEASATAVTTDNKQGAVRVSPHCSFPIARYRRGLYVICTILRPFAFAIFVEKSS